jgi:magnesium-transporting ATPase (P-type)
MVNTPINNAQGMSVLIGLLAKLPSTPISAIQILYSNFICAVTLGFVTAIEPAEDGIMDIPPRRVGKRLIGRYLFLRIVLATSVLTGCVVGSAVIVDQMGINAGLDIEERLYKIRAVSFNVLDFGACSVMMSARFSYNSSIHPRVFMGNPAALVSIAIVAVLQLMLTYIPGLNTFVFSMKGMDGYGWLLTFVSMLIVFIIMEIEKAIRRRLKASGADTDDREQGFFDSQVVPAGPDSMKLPKGASKLNLQELTH